MTLFNIFKRFKWKILLTLALVIFEAGSSILFPLFIGYAVSDILNGQYYGVIQLGVLALISLIIGISRRFYDSRAYSSIYIKLGTEIFGEGSNFSTSQDTARLNMLKELIEFFENSLPLLINNIIGMIGTLIIVFTLNLKIFTGCLIIIIVTIIIYGLTSSKTTFFNQEYNNELEKQVDIISQRTKKDLNTHIKKMMAWNIKLSDLEALNFSIIWFLLMCLMIFGIIVLARGEAEYGVIVSAIMYIFQFMTYAFNLPLYYQQWLRLKEIIGRFNRVT